MDASVSSPAARILSIKPTVIKMKPELATMADDDGENQSASPDRSNRPKLTKADLEYLDKTILR